MMYFQKTEKHTLGLLIGNDYYNAIILDERKKDKLTQKDKYKTISMSSNRNLDGLYLTEFHQPMTIRKKVLCFQ